MIIILFKTYLSFINIIIIIIIIITIIAISHYVLYLIYDDVLDVNLRSGLAVTVAMQPFDIVAVRLMNQPSVAIYSGPLDCCRKMLRHEGLPWPQRL